MTELYERRATISLNGRSFEGPLYARGHWIPGFRLVFDIERSLKQTGNKAEVSIYNLSATSRGLVQTPRPDGLYPLRVDAGYAEGTGVLFDGQATYVIHERTTTGFVTKATAADEVHAKQGVVNASFSPGVSFGQALKAAAEALGVSAKKAVAQAIAGDFDGAKKAFIQGVSLSGPANTVMDNLAKTAGFEWSVQDGELVIVPEDDFADPVAVLLSAKTGLLGSPWKVVDKKDSKKTIVAAKSLLQASLRVGGKVVLDSQELSGTYKIVHVKHKGDTHGAEWTSEVEMVNLAV